MLLQHNFGRFRVTGTVAQVAMSNSIGAKEVHMANAGEEDTWAVYDALSPISEKFTISMALRPDQLGRVQEGAARMLGGSSSSKPLFFVAYGGSGSEADEALSHGVVKVNVHTDDSRKSLREAEMSLAKRVGESCAELRNKN